MRTLVSISVASMMMFVGSLAFAQGEPAGTGGTAGGTATVTTPTPPTPPAAPAEHKAAPLTDDTPDHERVIKKFAIGYLGFNQVPLTQTETVSAPVIGARYWLFDRLGVDAGIGFGVKGGSQDTTPANGPKTTTDQATAWAFALHAGVPLTPAWGKHYTILLIPEINFGYSGRSLKATAPNTPNQDQNGARFEIGARAGGEVHFGFIGVPELSLQATIGLGFQNNQVWANNVGGANNATSAHSYTFTTSVDQAPWAIFTNNISALYYFP
jgi:hypothetical protein